MKKRKRDAARSGQPQAARWLAAPLVHSHFRELPTTPTCHECLTEGHAANAGYCYRCGAALPAYQRE